MRKNSRRKTMPTLINVSFATYMNFINYLQNENEKSIRYKLIENQITGNKVWKDNITNTIITERIVSQHEDDIYRIASYMLSQKNNFYKSVIG